VRTDIRERQGFAVLLAKQDDRLIEQHTAEGLIPNLV